MAEQGVTNQRRKELEHIDPFQENLLKAMDYAVKNKKALLLILGAVVVVCVTFAGIMYSFQNAENVASNLVAGAMTRYGEVKDPVKGFGAVKDDFETVLADYANTSAGRAATVIYAKITYEAGKYDKAFGLYQKALDIFGDDPSMKQFVLASLGHVCLAKKDNTAARSYFMQIEQGHAPLLKDEARFALAMVYEASKDKKKGLEMYEKIVNSPENSIYQQIAQSRIDALK